MVLRNRLEDVVFPAYPVFEEITEDLRRSGAVHALMSGSGSTVFGTFPDLSINGADDVGFGGRILPTTSVDKFYEEMSLWFGVSSSDMSMVLPNIGNFTTEPSIGFIA